MAREVSLEDMVIQSEEDMKSVKSGSFAVEEVFTDGACTKNGKRGASAGIGVYFGHGDARLAILICLLLW
jgi:hypothetical protein